MYQGKEVTESGGSRGNSSRLLRERHPASLLVKWKLFHDHTIQSRVAGNNTSRGRYGQPPNVTDDEDERLAPSQVPERGMFDPAASIGTLRDWAVADIKLVLKHTERYNNNGAVTKTQDWTWFCVRLWLDEVISVVYVDSKDSGLHSRLQVAHAVKRWDHGWQGDYGMVSSYLNDRECLPLNVYGRWNVHCGRMKISHWRSIFICKGFW